MEKNIYFSNGVAGFDEDSKDQPIQGLTVHVYKQNEQDEWTAVPMSGGKPYLGYKAKQLTEEEVKLWIKRIEGAGMMGNQGYKDEGGTWYSGRIGVGRSVIDADAYVFMQEQEKTNYETICKQQFEANRINFKLAQRDAEAIGEDHEAVFTSKHPKVSEDVKAMLFAEARKAKG